MLYLCIKHIKMNYNINNFKHTSTEIVWNGNYEDSFVISAEYNNKTLTDQELEDLDSETEYLLIFEKLH